MGSSKEAEDLKKRKKNGVPFDEPWPECDEDEQHVFMSRCPCNIDLPKGQDYVCKKGLGHMGYFDEMAKAQDRIRSHLTGSPSHNFTEDEADTEIHGTPKCIQVMVWKKSDWQAYDKKCKDHREKQKADEKEKKKTGRLRMAGTMPTRLNNITTASLRQLAQGGAQDRALTAGAAPRVQHTSVRLILLIILLSRNILRRLRIHLEVMLHGTQLRCWLLQAALQAS